MGGKIASRIRKILRSFKTVHIWQLLLILVPLIFLTATLLRFDHLKMVALRNDVLAADEAGDEEALSNSLEKLQKFVFSHVVINIQETNGVQKVIFGTGPFYLEGSYVRAANAAIEEAEKTLVDDSNPNGNIYAIVSGICQPLAIQNGWKWSDQPYLDCWMTELAKFPTSDDLSSTAIVAKVPSTELYRMNYASPVIAPSAACVVAIITIIVATIIVIKVIIWILLKLALVLLDK